MGTDCTNTIQQSSSFTRWIWSTGLNQCSRITIPTAWTAAFLHFLPLLGKGILLPTLAGPWKVLLPMESIQLYNLFAEKAENVEKYCVGSTQSPVWPSPFICMAWDIYTGAPESGSQFRVMCSHGIAVWATYIEINVFLGYLNLFLL